jgi:hypothetical protein
MAGPGLEDVAVIALAAERVAHSISLDQTTEGRAVIGQNDDG